MEPDHVDGILAQWRRERPDLDPSPIGLIGRLHRLADVLNVELRAVFAEAGLGDGDFDVLVTLRRNGAPYEMTPGELCASTMVTSSAVTKRIDRLERGGLVTRTVSEADARSRRIRLTDAGFELVDRLMAVPHRQRASAGRRSLRARPLPAGRPSCVAGARPLDDRVVR